MSRKLMRSSSQSSTATRRSVTSTWTTKTDFPSYEEIFYHPPVPKRVSRAYDASPLDRLDAFMGAESFLDADEHEGPIRELLEEMREWYIEQAEEVETKLHQPLDSTPCPDESDDELAIRRPFGAVRALRQQISSDFLSLPPVPASPSSPAFSSSQHSFQGTSKSLTPASSTSTLSPSTPRGPYTPSSSRSASKEPFDFDFPSPHRPFADVPRSPTVASFQDPDHGIPAYIPTRKAPVPPSESSVKMRARSASLPSAKKALRAAKSEASLDAKRSRRRPPPLNSSALTNGEEVRNRDRANVVLTQPEIDTSFSAPNSPATNEFSVISAAVPLPVPDVPPSPYMATSPDSLIPAPGAASRWSVSTAGKGGEDASVSRITAISFASGLPRAPRSRSLRRKRPLTPGTHVVLGASAPTRQLPAPPAASTHPHSPASDVATGAAPPTTFRARSSSSPGPESRARARTLPRKPSRLALNVGNLISKLKGRGAASPRGDR